MTTIRKQIISNIETALAGVLQTAGYNTDAGSHVYVAKRKLDKTESRSLAVWPGSEDVSRKYGKNECSLSVRIEALAMAMSGTEEPAEVGEILLGDVIEGMTAPVLTMAFTSGSHEISVGDTITGATSGATAYVAGVSLSAGTWAGGDAAGTLTLRRLAGKIVAESLDVGTDLNVATTSGTITAVTPVERVTGSLADDIAYTGSEIVYPDEEERVVGVRADFNIKYKTQVGDPYSQP